MESQVTLATHRPPASTSSSAVSLARSWLSMPALCCSKWPGCRAAEAAGAAVGSAGTRRSLAAGAAVGSAGTRRSLAAGAAVGGSTGTRRSLASSAAAAGSAGTQRSTGCAVSAGHSHHERCSQDRQSSRSQPQLLSDDHHCQPESQRRLMATLSDPEPLKHRRTRREDL